MDKKISAFHALFFVVSVLLAVLLISCETAPTQRRGSLSDAMNKSKDSNTGSRDVPEQSSPEAKPTPEIPQDSDDSSDSAATSSDTPFDSGSFIWGTRAGSTFSSSGDMGRDFDLDLLAGVAGPKCEGLMYAGFKAVEPVEDSDLDQSVSGSLLFLRLGGEIRYVPFDDREDFSPYIGAGVGGFLMGWEFQNDLSSSSGTIHGDSLKGAVLSVMAGMYIVRNETLSLGIAAIPELYLFGDLTSEGFDNDYFKPYGTVKFVGELLFR
jgi:hypothetical protein